MERVVMPYHIGVTQRGFPIVEATGEIKLLESDLISESRLHLCQEVVIQRAVARHVVTEEMMAQIHQPL